MHCIKYTTQFYQTYITHNEMDFYKEAITCVLNVVNKNKLYVFKDMWYTYKSVGTV